MPSIKATNNHGKSIVVDYEILGSRYDLSITSEMRHRKAAQALIEKLKVDGKLKIVNNRNSDVKGFTYELVTEKATEQ